MTKRLIIIGTGGSAHDALDIIDALNAHTPRWQVAGFLDDTRPVDTCHLGYKVLGPLHHASRFADHWFINVIGSDASFRHRPDVVGYTGVPAERFATVVHPGAQVSSRARLGLGVCINFGVAVAGGVEIGNHVCLCPGAIVGHDCVIEDYTLVAPGAILSGSVRVGRCGYVGSGALVRQRLNIGAGALIGMGAVVLHDVRAGATVIGNPAHTMRPRMPIEQMEILV